MNHRHVIFAGSAVSIEFSDSAAESFVRLLFYDLPESSSGASLTNALSISPEPGTDNHLLMDGEVLLHRGLLGVGFAAVLYDAVIYRLLEKAGGGIALHAGAVTTGTLTILLPGQSGSGKSTLTAWLTAQGYTYLTDELVFIPENEAHKLEFFSRPVCLKASGVSHIKRLIQKEYLPEMLEDDCGAIVPHRLLNPLFSGSPGQRRLILLPSFQSGAALSIEHLSAARLSTMLMSCHVNARNLTGHGFGQAVALARATPAYQLVYGGFQELREALSGILQENDLL